MMLDRVVLSTAYQFKNGCLKNSDTDNQTLNFSYLPLTD